MIKPQIPENEALRQRALDEYDILDTLSEKEYDDITLIASQICKTPVALISLIDRDRQWFKSKIGLKDNETPRDIAFCAHAINNPNQIFEVKNADEDVRFFDNPLVTGEVPVKYYAGAPLITEDGYAIGNLCVIDHKANSLNEHQHETLFALSRQVMAQLELRKKIKQLERVTKELKLKNEETTKISYVLAHDLKAGIRNIVTLSNFIKEDFHSESEEINRFFQLLSERAVYLQELVIGILNLAQAEKEEKHSVIILKKLVDQIIEIVQPTIDIVIKNNCDDLVLTINKTALIQIIQNLMTNAIKYNDKPVVEIEITSKSDTAFHTISISDNGIGISEGDLESIFEIFSTATNNDRFGQKGNGIGLATVKKLIDKLNGTITVKSELGKGTQFTIKLPVNKLPVNQLNQIPKAVILPF